METNNKLFLLTWSCRLRLRAMMAKSAPTDVEPSCVGMTLIYKAQTQTQYKYEKK